MDVLLEPSLGDPGGFPGLSVSRAAGLGGKWGEKQLPSDVLSDDTSTRILRSELLRLRANAAVALERFEEAKFAYMAAKDFNPKIQGVDEALRALRGR